MYKYVFGPVPSRRLGVSLGIDLVEAKTCNLNCIYCECGSNEKTYSERSDYVDIDKVKKELIEALKTIKPNYITFSGSGEPTLNKSIGKLIRWVKDETPYNVAVITNSTLLKHNDVVEEILDADIVLPSVDAISEDVFLKMNRPHSTIRSLDILDGLRNFTSKYTGKVYLEVFITAGVNDSEDELKRFAEFFKELKVDGIQLNTLARPGAVEWIKPATFERLEEIKKYFEDSGIDGVEIIKKYSKRHQMKEYKSSNEDLIMNMIEKRPYTLEELEGVIGNNLHKYLEVLGAENKIKTSYREGFFYVEKQ